MAAAGSVGSYIRATPQLSHRAWSCLTTCLHRGQMFGMFILMGQIVNRIPRRMKPPAIHQFPRKSPSNPMAKRTTAETLDISMSF